MYRALIVEDEDLMREYLSAKLSELCPEWEAAATAADGMEAVERMAHERFDAVITDIRMPGMDGLELTRYIRYTDREMPILILSGYDEFQYARVAMRLNVFDYLLKPINEEELSAALSSMATVAAANKAKADTQSTLQALAGEPAALASLRSMAHGKSLGLLMIAPSLTLLPSERAEQARHLPEKICGGFWRAEVLSSGITAVLCAACDPLLVATEGRAVFEHVCEQYTSCSLHAGFAAFDPEHAQLAAPAAEAALRVALTTNVAWVGQPLLYTQRQHLLMLEAMRASLADAIAKQSLDDQQRAALLAALRDIPAYAALPSAIHLIWDCDAPDHAREQALQALLSPSGTSPDTPLPLKTASVGTLLPHVDQMPSSASPLVKPEAGFAAETTAGIDSRFSLAVDFLLRPEQNAEPAASALVERARDYLRLHFAQPISLSTLADTMGVTSAYMSALFHREIGLSYSRYLLTLRMEDAARRLLADPDARISDVGEAVGFPSAKHFSHVFGQYYHLSPKEYREQKKPPRG